MGDHIAMRNERRKGLGGDSSGGKKGRGKGGGRPGFEGKSFGKVKAKKTGKGWGEEVMYLGLMPSLWNFSSCRVSICFAFLKTECRWWLQPQGTKGPESGVLT
jgi:hypothetical protein